MFLERHGSDLTAAERRQFDCLKYACWAVHSCCLQLLWSVAVDRLGAACGAAAGSESDRGSSMPTCTCRGDYEVQFYLRLLEEQQDAGKQAAVARNRRLAYMNRSVRAWEGSQGGYGRTMWLRAGMQPAAVRCRQACW